MKKISELFAAMTKKQKISLGASILVFLAILLIRPLGMTQRQALILGTLLLALIWFTTGCVRKWVTALVMLLGFSIYGGTPLKSVFQFPLSENFLVIFFAFLFSQAISNSGLTRRLLLPVLQRYVGSVGKFLVFVLLCNVAFIFVIPQPFARVILLAFILSEYLSQVCPDKKAKEALMFSVYCLSMTANMMFLRGDIIMNYAILSFAELSLSEAQWLQAMALPTLLLLAVETVLIRVVFGRSLKGITFLSPEKGEEAPLAGKSKAQLAVILLTILLMATESLHGISGWIVILSGSLVLACLGVLKPVDLKSVNYELLAFFTAAFSIGPVMKTSGVADLIFSRFIPLFPAEFGIGYLLLVMVITMVLHMILGSAVTTTSVVVPGILLIASGVAPSVPLVLAIYVAVYAHFLLPIHNVVLLIGNKDYDSSLVTRFGVVSTVLIPVFILAVYYSWWQIVGIL